jgi:FkbM family methyltransferase
MARFLSSFKLLKVYEVSLFGKDFSIESGPRDDHYLDLEKDGLRTWEHEALLIWAREVRNAELAVDIGAYLGIYSILAAKLGCPRVLAFEPNSSNFVQLQKNLLLNNLGDSVESHRVAVGAESKTVSMITPGGRPNSSGSQISDSPTGRELGSWEIESDVDMVTLDSLLDDETARISVIKIDAEGYELFVLQGATKTLKSQGPSILIELLNEEKKSEADDFLMTFGYSQGRPIETSGVCTNFFYQKPNE